MSAYALDHVALAVPSWNVAAPVLAGVLGGRWKHGFRLESMNNCQLSYGNDMRVELLEPGSAPDSFVGKFLAAGGGASRPHHITFKVDDIEESLRAASSEGMEPILMSIGNPVWREYFLHPKTTGLGFLAQVVESTGEPSELNPSGSLPAPWPAPSIGPAELPFILVDVDKPDRPRRVLTGVLGASEAVEAGLRRFSWPSGADLILTGADARTEAHSSGIRAIGVSGPVELPLHPGPEGYGRSGVIAALGVELLVRQG